jgi:nucleotide-binding universal stress UspA family protein
MYRVLLPVDPDESRAKAAVEAVAALPNATDDVEVVVLSVFQKRDVQDLDGGRLESDELFERSEAPESLKNTAKFLEERGIKVTARREHGDPKDVILDIADAEDVDSIVMSGRKRSAVGKVMFGSVTQSVILNSSRPVTIADASE